MRKNPVNEGKRWLEQAAEDSTKGYKDDRT